MKIGSRISGEFLAGKDAVRNAEAQATTQAAKVVEARVSGAVRQADRVELSDAGRALSSLSQEKIAAIRGKIADGTYNDAKVLYSVASRILDRGDA